MNLHPAQRAAFGPAGRAPVKGPARAPHALPLPLSLPLPLPLPQQGMGPSAESTQGPPFSPRSPLPQHGRPGCRAPAASCRKAVQTRSSSGGKRGSWPLPSAKSENWVVSWPTSLSSSGVRTSRESAATELAICEGENSCTRRIASWARPTTNAWALAWPRTSSRMAMAQSTWEASLAVRSPGWKSTSLSTRAEVKDACIARRSYCLQRPNW
mmetsp:Transcript_85101/g.241153  ORF Transcript_85101/g.241153 Transcript_85101/m.241153 type:complete len:212 (-) Transcript_85101:610-1245(-)